ncbi:hypothetical protein CQW23_32152 [Capsicum baccatum]|uniref:Uncharacterized protein n=1 Tax=Capsicum baccatum TaxID=33114 RepID=A0A2G2V5J0_CAPBA|nr:hypothetical protein CQW23_32152 [Capsicum baccatum]
MMDVMRLLTSHDPNLRSFGAGSAPDTLYEGSFITFGSFLKRVFVFAQTAPLDLETDSFYEARKGALLDKIEHGMAEELLIMSENHMWEQPVGESIGTSIPYLGSEQLLHALGVFALHQFAAIWLKITGVGRVECLTYCCGASMTTTVAKQS